MIDGQLLDDCVEGCTQQSIVIERTDQILHHITVAVGQLHLTHLLQQLVVERLCIAQHHVLALIGCRHAAVINGQVLIIAPYVLKGSIQRIAAFLTLTLTVKIIGCILGIGEVGRLREVGVFRVRLQCGVIMHLGLDTLHQLLNGQLHQLRLQQLLLRDTLLQLLLKLLFLYLTLWHCFSL